MELVVDLLLLSLEHFVAKQLGSIAFITGPVKHRKVGDK